MSSTAELLPPPPVSSPRERRRFERLRLRSIVPTYIGRASGTLVDLSANGARVRHTTPLALRTQARFTFTWKDQRFEATAEVLASRVVSLAAPTRFESRLRFVSVPDASEHVLARALADIAEDDLRRWVANLRGWENGPQETSPAESEEGTFVRCSYVKGRWERKWTHDAGQPEEGFTVPAGTETAEIETLCRTYANADENGRKMVRAFARAVVQQQDHTSRRPHGIP